MKKIQNQIFVQLLNQLRFTPLVKRKEQIESAIKLLEIIEPQNEYPYEFISFKIIGHRLKTPLDEVLIKGDTLISDLQIFISKLSSLICPAASEQGQKVYKLEELAEYLKVSSKTIGRWRKRGLIARKFIFENGKKLYGYQMSDVDNFLNANKELIEKAGDFTKVGAAEKKSIINKAVSLAKKTNLSASKIIEQIASETNRSHETIRVIIKNYQKQNQNKKIFKKDSLIVDTHTSHEILRLFGQGVVIEELEKRFQRSRSSIYRIIKFAKARSVLAAKFDYVESDEFIDGSASEEILAMPLDAILPTVPSPNFDLTRLKDSSFSAYLKSINDTVILNREQEAVLFRRYNYLKYLFTITKSGIKAGDISSVLLSKLENWLNEAERIKKILIEANLPLVVSIANKHVNSSVTLLELVSEGNVSLMRAVEKFDYTKGFRFSTYATWRITKDFAQKLPLHLSRLEIIDPESVETIQKDFRLAATAGVEMIERAQKSLVDVIRNNLNTREQYIILNHFGLTGSFVKKNIKTLGQIGEDLGLSKERIRQLELQALQKLRQLLSTEQFEMLKENS